MSLGKSIIKNTFWLISAEIIGSILLAITGIIIARYLGDSEFGKFSFAFSFVTLFSVLADYGFLNYFINEIARDKTKMQKYFNNIITLKVIVSIIYFLIIFLAIWFTQKSIDVKFIVLLAGLNTIAISYNMFFFAIFRAQEKMKYEAILKTVQNVLMFLFLLVAIFLHFKIVKLVQSYLYPVIISVIITAIFIHKKFVKFKFEFNINLWQKIMREALPFALSSIFISIYYYISIVILSFWKNDAEVGWYNSAYKILLVLLGIIGLYYTAIFPVVSRLFIESKEKLELLLKITARGALILGLPIAFAFLILAKPIIILLYGNEFVNGAEALKIMGFTISVIFLSGVYANSLLACTQRKKYTIGVGIGAITNIVLGFILIPKLGLRGAAIVTLVTETIVLVYMYFSFSKLIFKVNFVQYLFKPLMAAIIMAYVLYLFKNYHIIALSFFGAMIYFTILIILKGVKKEDLVFLKQVLKS